MADISKIKINDTTYNVKDANALTDAPTDGDEYVRKNGAWAISSGGGGGGSAVRAHYFYQQPVSVGTNAEIMRITDSRINGDSVVLECVFANPEAITSEVTWTSYSGYISFTGSCSFVTTANVTLGYSTSDNISQRLMTLLWENPSPNSEFAAQTISLDLSQYDFVMVMYGGTGYGNETIGNNSIILENVVGTDKFGVMDHNTTQDMHGRRLVYIQSNGIEFKTGSYWNGTTNTNNNYVCIPKKIYGINRYSVAKSGFGEPIQISSLANGWTAPCDGFFHGCFHGNTGGAGNFSYVYLHNSRYPSIQVYAGSMAEAGGRYVVSCPVKMGDELTVQSANDNTTIIMVFYPYG